jgi:hypothetical protein
MEQIEIPNGISDFTFRTLLEGAPFTFRMRWNMRSGWYIGCTAADGVTLFSPRRAVCDWNILTGITDNRCPRGLLMLLDNTEQHVEAGLNDLNKSHFLVYLTAADMAEYV